MPRFLLKQKYFAIRDGFNVKDASGRDCFYVQGKVFTLAKKLWLYSLNGQEIFYIKQRLFRLFPRYDIMQNGELVGKMKRTFPVLLGKRYKISSDRYGDMTTYGTFGFNFTVKQDGQDVGRISKKILKIADTYTVDVHDHRLASYMLAIALVIDARHHRSH